MELVVNDTNIFIDLYSVGLLPALCELPYIIHTVDFVVEELLITEQRQALLQLHSEGKFFIQRFSSEQLEDLIALHDSTPGNISLTDTAVFYHARRIGGTLLTGDGQLRRFAESHDIPVRGIIFIFDELVKYRIISPPEAAEKLRQLLQINIRLPKSEIEKRISTWSVIGDQKLLHDQSPSHKSNSTTL